MAAKAIDAERAGKSKRRPTWGGVFVELLKAEN
jgi:hypothetical protein